MAKISIIVPVYNAEQYLDQCVASLLGQTFSDLEVLLVDDGSTDTSGRKCDSWAEKDCRVRVIHKANGGPQSAVNEGVKGASSDIIGFCDSDDYVAADYYETLYEAFTSSGVDLVSCKLKTVYDGENTEYNSDRTHVILSREEIQQEYWEKTGKFLIGNNRYTKLHRKQFLLEILEESKPSLRFGEDALQCHLYLERCERVCILENYDGYFYRQVSTSLMNAFKERQIDDNITYVRAMEEIAEKYGHAFLTRDTFSDRLMCNLMYRCIDSGLPVSQKCGYIKRIRSELTDPENFMRENLRRLNPVLRVGFYLIQGGFVRLGTVYGSTYIRMLRVLRRG